MRLKRLTVKGVGCFKDEITIPFGELPDGIVCFVGSNGTGKSTLLEASGPAALFREFPTRNPSTFLALCSARDSFVDLEFEHGGDSVRLLVRGDPQAGGGRGKQEAYAYVNGQAVVSTGKTGEFDAWVADRLVPRSMYFSNLFTVQKPQALKGVGAFAGLSPRDRAELFVEMLGIGRLQAMAETAGRVLAVVQPLHERTRDRLDELQGSAGRLDELEAEEVTESAKLASLEAKHEETATKKAAAATQYQEARERLAALRATADAVRSRLDEWTRTERRRTEAENELVEARKFVEAHADGAREAADRLAAVKVVLADLESNGEAVAAEHQAAATEHTKAEAEVQRLTSEAARIGRELKAAEKAIADLEGSVSATECRPAVEVAEELESTKAAIDDLRDRERSLTDQLGTVAAMRSRLEAAQAEIAGVEARTSVLDRVPCGGAGEFAGCELLTGAKQERGNLGELRAKAADLRDKLEELAGVDDALAGVRYGIQTQNKRVVRLEGELATAREVEASEAMLCVRRERLAALATEREETERSSQIAISVLAEARAKLDEARAKLDEARAVYGHQRSVAKDLEVRAAMVQRVEQCEATAAEREREIDDLDEKIKRLRSAGVGEVDEAAVTAAAEAAEAADKAHLEADEANRLARLAVSEQRAVLARIAGAREQIGDLPAKTAKLRSRVDRLAVEIGIWTVLQQALGRKGIQLLEIDAAGPHVSGLANTLLAETYGDRFTVEIVTLRAKKSPRAGEDPFKDVFSVDVIDGARGLRSEIDNLSGGEEVVVADCLKDALAIFGNQRLPVPVATQWADEATAALSEDLVGGYFARKRKAMELGGVRQLLMITHQREMWEQADAIVRTFPGGRVSVEVR